MPENLEIYSADATFVDVVVPLIEQSFSPEYGEAWTRSQCQSMLMLHSCRLTLADYGGQSCGFMITRRAADEEELLLFAVTPQFRGKKIGTKMLSHFIDTARQNKIERLFLEVRSNNPAVQLYEDIGFFLIGKRKGYYKGTENSRFDAHTYRLDLI